MAEIGSAFVSILPSAKGFGSSLNRQVGPSVNSSAKSMGVSFGKIFGAIAVLGLGTKLIGFFKGSFDEAKEAAVVGARTENVIKKMGASAWISSKQVEALAGSLSKKAGVDDEAVQSGQNLLLTFGNVRNEVGKGNDIFNQASGLMVDMSAAMGTDMKGSAIQLGKALNDPIKGVSALTRVGVSFTEGQKEQIATLVENGETLKAQKIILGEVEKQFGGAAKAMATPADKAAVAWGNFKEVIGNLILPLADRILTAFTPLVNKLSGKIETIGDAFKYLFGGGDEGVRGFAEILDSAFGNTGKYIDPIVQITEFLKLMLGAAADVRSEIGERLAPVFERLGGFLRDNPEFVKAFAIALGVLVGAISAVTIATTLFSLALQTTGIPILIIAIAALVAGLVVAYQKSEQFRAIVDQIGIVLVAFGGWLRNTVLPAVVELAQKVGDNLKPIFEQLAETFRNDILPTIIKVAERFKEWMPTIQSVAEFIGKLIGKLVEFYTAVLGKVLPVVIRFVGFIISKAVPAILDYIEAVAKIIGKLIDFGGAVGDAAGDVIDFAKTVAKKIGEVVGFFNKLPERIKNAVGDLGSLLTEKGKALIQGFLNGIETAFGWVKNKLNDILAWISDKVSTIKSLISSVGGISKGSNNPFDGLNGLNPRTVQPETPRRSTFGGGDAAQIDQRLARIEAAILSVAPGVGREINGAASDGHRRRAAVA